MKIIALCLLAFVAGALADCGCLKCNPNLRIVSLANAPVKVIYRNGNQNSPYRAPYTLQAAVPLDVSQPFVPTEYDYQLQVVPVGNPPLSCGGSTYEYGLQAAVVPPEPLVAPLTNLRTNTERIVLDAPNRNYIRGSTCNTGSPCPALEGRPLPPVAQPRYTYRSRAPIFEYLNTCGRYAYINSNNIDELTRHIARNYKTCRQRRDLLRKNRKFRHKRDILDLPMNFMFKFLPNLFKGPILHVLHSIQHNANPAVIRARANANKQILKAHAAKVKLKNNHLDHNFKDKTVIAQLGPNRKFKHLIHSPSHKIGKVFINKKGTNEGFVASSSPQLSNNLRNHILKKQHNQQNNDISTPSIEFWKDLIAALSSSKYLDPHKVGKVSRRINEKETDEETVSLTKYIVPNRSLKHISKKQPYREPNDILTHNNKSWRDLIEILNNSVKSHSDLSRVSSPWRSGRKPEMSELDEEDLENLLLRDENSQGEIRDIILEKLRSFNEVHEKTRRSLLPGKDFGIRGNHIPWKSSIGRNEDIKLEEFIEPTHISREILLQKLKKFNETFKRKKRSILLGKEEFSLPFFEIEDDVLDNAVGNLENSEEIVGSRGHHNRRRNHRRRYEESETDSDEEIVGRALNDHPFVVLLRAPLQFLQQFHDIRKNFRPILYSFPKLLKSSKKYLRDFGKNFQTGVLDFASNIIGDFDNTAPRLPHSIISPRRPRRSIDQNSIDFPANRKLQRQKRYILKVVDEGEVQEFLEEKLGGYFGDDEDEKQTNEKKISKKHDNNSEEENVSEDIHKKKKERKFVVRKLAPKVILDNNGKAFVEINGNKRPLFHGKHHHSHTTSTEKSNHKPDEEITQLESKDSDPADHDINDKIDEVIKKAKRKLKDGDIMEPCNSDEMPTHTVKEKIFQISADIQNLINLNFCEYNEIYEGLLKLENLRKLTTEYWKNVMINEKTNDIRCKIRILNYFREMQNEKDNVTRKIAELLRTSDKFIVKKMIKLLVRLQKLQCLIQKVVDHFDNRMKIGTITDTEREIKFVDYLSTLNFVAGKNKEDLESSLNKEKNEALERGIRLLENLRILLQKDDTYTINEIAKQIWEMKNIEKLQQDTIEEMNKKLEDNMKIRKELKILFDLLKQVEASEEACGKLLAKYDSHIVGSKGPHLPDKRLRERLSFAERLRKLRSNRKKALSKDK